MRRNLDDGVFHFVVLMDQLTDRLKDLVLYVNQNSQFDIYAVEFEYYKHDEYEIIIPKLFGAEVKKDIGVKTKNSPRESWNEEKLLNQARELLSDKEFNGFKEFYEFSKQSADQINFGSGQTSSFNPVWLKYSDRSLFSVYSDGTLKVNFHWLLKEDGSNKELIDKLRNNLSDAGLDIPEGHTDERLIYKNKKLPQELFLVFL